MEQERIPAEAFLAMYRDPIRALAERLCTVVRETLPEAIERVRLGWRIVGFDVPNGRRSGRRSGRASRGGSRYFCFVMPEAEHVHLGFHYGVFMDDPGRALHGNVRQARWLTFRPGDTIDEALMSRLIREGARVALLSRPERLSRLLDAESAPMEGRASLR